MTAFEYFIALKVAEFKKAHELGLIKDYSMRPDYKTETLHVDVSFVLPEPIEYIELKVIGTKHGFSKFVSDEEQG